MTWFDHDGRPTAVDLTHPVEALEPEGGEAQERVMSGEQFRQLVMRIAETFSTGDPKITVVAWRIVAGDNWESIRACARRVGCTAQAVSRRIGIIRQEWVRLRANSEGLPVGKLASVSKGNGRRSFNLLPSPVMTNRKRTLLPS
jgi:hypothetical protein